MRKIISLFQRNYDTDRLVRDEVVEGAEWVLAGEGDATIKLDGTCCMVRDNRLYRRYEVKKGKTPPPDFEATGDADAKTGKQTGWRLVGDDSDAKWHREAWESVGGELSDGTYELVGPKIQGGAEGAEKHMLVPHGATAIHGCPRTFEGIKRFFSEAAVEGIVFHHPDGRMVKIKVKDFGFPRKPGKGPGVPS